MPETFKAKVLKIEPDAIVLEVILDDGNEFTNDKTVIQPRRFKKEYFKNITLAIGKFLLVVVSKEILTVHETLEDFSHLFEKTIFFDGLNLIS